MLPTRAPRVSSACWWGAVSVAVLLLASPARAEDPAAAKVLFDHGLDEMKQGRYASGCTAIEDSYKLNPLPGALFTLAECEGKRGRFATAVRRYEEYLAVFAKLSRDKQAKQHGRDGLSTTQIGALTPQVPRVTVVLGDAPPPGVVTTIDGVPVDPTRLGAPIPIDPGDHVVFVKAPGGSPVEQSFTVGRGEQKTLAIDLAPKPPPVQAPPPGPGVLRIASYVAGGVGIASIAAGAITGGLALGKKSTIQQHCKLDGTTGVASCDPTGFAAGNSAGTLGGASTGTFIVGAIALGAAVGLFVASPSPSPSPPKQAGAAAPRVEISVLAAGPERVVLGVEGAF